MAKTAKRGWRTVGWIVGFIGAGVWLFVVAMALSPISAEGQDCGSVLFRKVSGSPSCDHYFNGGTLYLIVGSVVGVAMLLVAALLVRRNGASGSSFG